jgi:hypothetical protein
MKHVIGVMLVGRLLVGTAHASPADALSYVRDAIDLVDDQGGKCRRDAIEGLLEIKSLLRDEDNDRALARLKAMRRSTDRCPARVEKLLRSARRAIEDDRDRDDDPPPPKRPAGVPYADWNSDCRDHWMITEVARYNTADATLDKMNAMFGQACVNAQGMGAANYPNGQTAKSSSGDWYYPNGQTAKSSDGAFYYPNGQTARSSSGDWYYPNGQTARSSSGTWYYRNGADAGGWQALVSYGCPKAGEAACAKYRLALKSDLEDWRNFAVVQLVSRTN